MEGLFIIRKHEEIVRFESKHFDTVIKQKYSNDGYEISTIHFPKDRILFISPYQQDSMDKSYYIVAGEFRVIETGELLTQGDMIICKSLEEVVSLKAVTSGVILIHVNKQNYFDTITARTTQMLELLHQIEIKDAYTESHSLRVKEYCKAMAIALGYSSHRLYAIISAAQFHDIGKIGIVDVILNKAGALTAHEYENIKCHVENGRETIIACYDEGIYSIVSQHHERLDGTGYPMGLRGDEIGEEGRILAICDCYDAMTTDRVYKRGKSQDEAFAELRHMAKDKLDSRLVEVFINLLEEMNSEDSTNRES